MYKNLSELVFLAAIIFYTAEGFYINPSYDYFDRNKRGHATVCVQIQPPHVVGNHEPYFMCKGPAFPASQTQPNVASPAVGDYVNFNQQQQQQKRQQRAENEETLQFGKRNQETAQIKQSDDNNNDDRQLPIEPMVQPSPVVQAATQRDGQENTEPAMPINSDYPLANPLAGSPNTREDSEKQPIKWPPAEIMIKQEEKDEEYQDNYNLDYQDVHPDDDFIVDDGEIWHAHHVGSAHDEMLAVQNLFSEPKMPSTPPQAAQIPPEYYNDPVLRTFYNIDHQPTPAGLNWQPYLPPILPQINRILQEPLLGDVKNINYYANSQSPPTHTESTKKCFNWPFTAQPIFLAIPLFNAPYQTGAWVQEPNRKALPMYDYKASNFYRGSDRSESESDDVGGGVEENLFVGDAKAKTIEAHNKESSTKYPATSEEELFVEDTTLKTDKATSKPLHPKSKEVSKNLKEDISTSTSRTLQTTVKSFKSLLDAAKTHAVRNNEPKGSAMPQNVNKRQIQYINKGVYPYNSKRQYVRKLRNNNHSNYY